MADFTESKSGPSVYPEQAIESDYQRTEPLITPEQLLRRFLMGVDLSSQMRDPLTGKAMRWTAEMIKDIIDSAFSTAEAELGVNLRPIVIKENHPFSRIEFNAYGFFQLRQRPVSKLIGIGVQMPNLEEIYRFPLEWTSTSYLPRGQVNIIPLTASMVGGTSAGISPTGSSGGSFYLTIVQSVGFVPSYFSIEYVSGFSDDCVPRMVNDLLGCIAASDILSMVAATYAKTNSHSLSIDGLGQSQSGNGGQLFNQRRDDLDKRRILLVKKLKTLFGRKIMVSSL